MPYPSPDSVSPWSGWANAEIYDDFVRRAGIYRELNRRLVELAEVATAHRVLDLACGTGATAAACLAVLPATGELVGVDGSPAMVGVARARTPDRRARFEVAAAAEIGAVVDGPFDRAVCNAAFSQFPSSTAVLTAVAALLAPGARLVFNLAAAQLAGEPSRPHPYQVALSRAVAAGVRPGWRSAAIAVDPAHLADLLDRAGFDLERRERFVYRGRQSELMELMEIPAMIARAAPDASLGRRRRALAKARHRTDAEQPVEVPWIYFLARRR